MEVARKPELADLNEMERVALVALIGRIVTADRTGSESEQEHVTSVIEALGIESWDRAFETADRLFKDDDDLKAYLECIRRPDARDLIYGAVVSVSMAESVTSAEAAFLDWLAKLWNVEARPVPDA